MARIARVVVPELPMLPSAAIGASRWFSRPTIIAFIAVSSPRQRGAPVPPSGPTA